MRNDNEVTGRYVGKWVGNRWSDKEFSMCVVLIEFAWPGHSRARRPILHLARHILQAQTSWPDRFP